MNSARRLMAQMRNRLHRTRLDIELNVGSRWLSMLQCVTCVSVLLMVLGRLRSVMNVLWISGLVTSCLLRCGRVLLTVVSSVELKLWTDGLLSG